LGGTQTVFSDQRQTVFLKKNRPASFERADSKVFGGKLETKTKLPKNVRPAAVVSSAVLNRIGEIKKEGIAFPKRPKAEVKFLATKAAAKQLESKKELVTKRPTRHLGDMTIVDLTLTHGGPTLFSLDAEAEKLRIPINWLPG